MSKLVFGRSQSLYGYVDDAAGTLCMPPPGPAVFRHFVDVVADHAGCIYGRRIYEVMRYWDVDRPEWDVAEREFAAAWRRQPKWIASRTLASVGPNATLIRDDLDAFVRDLKATVDGELDVAGPELAARTLYGGGPSQMDHESSSDDDTVGNHESVSDQDSGEDSELATQ